MCGIAGYFSYGASASPQPRQVLEAVRDAMAARGPDGSGIWISDDKRVGLAHRRLSIIDTSDGGAQPKHLPADGLSITYNGEIYNFRELKAELEASGRVFNSQSDTEVLLHLYAIYGIDMCRKLRGMYAFAIHDARKGGMLLARDPYGIKPLYYADFGGNFYFASQVRALLKDPAISRDPSPAGLVGFHIFGSVPEPFTLFRAIKACPAGSAIWVGSEGVSAPSSFASIAGALANAVTVPADRADIASALRDSVRHHLVADVEVGAFLSGGVDSAAIVGLMRDCGQSRITACTLAFEEHRGTPSDELGRANLIARAYDVHHHVRVISRDEYRADLPAIMAAMDQPSIDGVNSWFVSKACRELGLKVALSGLGGDELLGGYSTFQTVPELVRKAGPFARNPVTGPVLRALLHKASPILMRRNPKLTGLFDLSQSVAGAYLLRRAVLLPFEMDNVMNAGIAREGLAELQPEALVAKAFDPEPGSLTAKMAALESSLYMRNQLLRDSDWAGMAHSLEVRVPWVDYQLLQAVAPVAGSLKPGDGKAILAHAPETKVPTAIVNHPKTGFQIPTALWSNLGEAQAARTDARHALAPTLAAYRESAGL